MPDPRVLLVVGASRPDHNVDRAADALQAAAVAAGAELRRLELSRLQLPVMASGSDEQSTLAQVVEIREAAAWAQGFLLVTPEYHGSMSGALKNWFDYLWEELAGKFAGVVAVTGGGGGDMSITAVKTCFQWCHGFTLPFHAACRPGDFDPDGALVGPRVLDRIARIAHDVCRYAPVLGAAFAQARTRGTAVEAGVAGLHVDEE
jgi:NAD(P)H-dependent FMN reductase